MSTAPATPPAKQRGLPRPFVVVCVVIGAVIGAYGALTLLSQLTASTVHRTRTFRAVDELRVRAGSGDVTVIGGPRRDVRVDMAIQRGMFRGAWKPEVGVRAGGRELELNSNCSVWEQIGVGHCGASFTISVPRGTRVVVEASSGEVDVSKLDGPVTVDASSGDVHAAVVRGPLTINASSGDVRVDDHRGHVVSATASSGDIDIHAAVPPRRLRAEASSGDVTVLVPDVTYRVESDADSGDEEVQVRQDPDAPRVIEAQASSGSVSVQRLLAPG